MRPLKLTKTADLKNYIQDGPFRNTQHGDLIKEVALF